MLVQVMSATFIFSTATACYAYVKGKASLYLRNKYTDAVADASLKVKEVVMTTATEMIIKTKNGLVKTFTTLVDYKYLTFFTILILVGFCLVTMKQRIKELVRKLISKARGEGKTGPERDQILKTIIDGLAAAALVVGTAGVIFTGLPLAKVTSTLKEIGIVKAAVSVAAPVVSLIVKYASSGIEILGFEKYFLGKKATRLTQGIKFLPQLVSLDDLDSEALKSYLTEVEGRQKEQDDELSKEEKQKVLTRQYLTQQIEATTREDVETRLTLWWNFYQQWYEKKNMTPKQIIDHLQLLEDGFRTRRIKEVGPTNAASVPYYVLTKIKIEGDKMSITPLLMKEMKKDKEKEMTDEEIDTLVFSPEEGKKVNINPKDFTEKTLYDQLTESEWVRYAAIVVAVVVCSLCAYYIYAYTWGKEELSNEVAVKVVDKKTKRNKNVTIPECIHYDSCPMKLPVSPGKLCHVQCNGHNCIHFAGCDPAKAKLELQKGQSPSVPEGFQDVFIDSAIEALFEAAAAGLIWIFWAPKPEGGCGNGTPNKHEEKDCKKTYTRFVPICVEKPQSAIDNDMKDRIRESYGLNHAASDTSSRCNENPFDKVVHSNDVGFVRYTFDCPLHTPDPQIRRGDPIIMQKKEGNRVSPAMNGLLGLMRKTGQKTQADQLEKDMLGNLGSLNSATRIVSVQPLFPDLHTGHPLTPVTTVKQLSDITSTGLDGNEIAVGPELRRFIDSITNGTLRPQDIGPSELAHTRNQLHVAIHRGTTTQRDACLRFLSDLHMVEINRAKATPQNPNPHNLPKRLTTPTIISTGGRKYLRPAAETEKEAVKKQIEILPPFTPAHFAKGFYNVSQMTGEDWNNAAITNPVLRPILDRVEEMKRERDEKDETDDELVIEESEPEKEKEQCTEGPAPRSTRKKRKPNPETAVQPEEDVKAENNNKRNKKKRMTDEQYEEYMKRRKEIAGKYVNFARAAQNHMDMTEEEFQDAADAWEDKFNKDYIPKKDKRYARKQQAYKRVYDNTPMKGDYGDDGLSGWADDVDQNDDEYTFGINDLAQFKKEEAGIFASILREERERARVKGGPRWRGEGKKKNIDQIREMAPKDTKGKEKEVKTKGKKVEETDFNKPCPIPGCLGTFHQGNKKVMDKKTGKEINLPARSVPCKYTHVQKECKLIETHLSDEGEEIYTCVRAAKHKYTPAEEMMQEIIRPESLVKGSFVLPATVSPTKALIVKAMTKAGQSIGNCFAIFSYLLTCQHIGPEGEHKLVRPGENKPGPYGLIETKGKFKQYSDLDLMLADKSTTGLQFSSYHPAIAKIGELVTIAAWDVTDPNNPKWWISTGNVSELSSQYSHLKGHLCADYSSKPGMSGAAIFNQQGQVVGVHSHGQEFYAETNAFLAFDQQMVTDFGRGGLANTP